MHEIISAVVIDDDDEHIRAVTDALGRKGISSYPIYFRLPVEAFALCEGVSEAQPRIIITDIQIIPGAGPHATSNDYALIVGCIKRLVVSVNGPYAVIVWTDKTEYLEALETYINDYLEEEGITKPFYFGSISKEECREPNGEYSADKIFKYFSNQLKQEKEIKALMHWEKQILKAANSTVNTLIRASGGKLRKVLCALAKGVAGDHLQDVSAEAINESLVLILRDEVSKAMACKESEEIWKGALLPLEEEKIDSEKFRLNTLLHIDTKSQQDVTCPGDVWEIGKPKHFFENLTVESDVYLQAKAFKQLFLCSTKIRSCENRLKQIKKPKEIENIKSDLVGHRKELKDAKGASRYVVVEISPQCDFTNKKRPLNTLVMGLLVPNQVIGKNVQLRNHDSEFRIPILYKDIEYVLSVSAKYVLAMSTQQIECSNLQMNKLFRVREEFLQSWIQDISTYNARIGTVSFD